ncbi:dethiobiotin synthase [Halomonas sabkhae]|uniref:dethiobiotin synthase n=1 Tax=Halomonas sabkhae TaxID=626223 RepID=UPI0025B3D0F8|nr:dethiobiotin synthase [Halomonas sabkhae]MDN3523719.1 dethiobiotin synthase [Halomonas sabkhae]
MGAYFVTGTDTDAGKTLVASGLLALARQRGMSTLGLKPVASGCDRTPAGLRNIDALTLGEQSTPEVPYETINPYAYEPAIAPHLAARRAGRVPTLNDLVAATTEPLARQRDLTLIEGAGGWRVPLNEHEDLAGLAVRLRLPVILVVGLKLGCLNHARLSAEAIRADGLQLVGWTGNLIDPDFAADENNYQANLDTLGQTLQAPCLGLVPRLDAGSPGQRATAAAQHLSLAGAD